MRKKALQVVLVAAVLLFSGWLFHHDKAAQPGALSRSHADLGDCSFCHDPWKGVSVQQCLECHDFVDTSLLRREMRFHEARRRCMSCHKEHRLMEAGVSKMEHTLLNEKLLCTQCHFDPHEGLFGESCRECHRIRTWKVEGYRHPHADRTDCHLCHKGPDSHYDARFWKVIVEEMEMESVDRKECWQCHTIFHWSHLKQRKKLEASSAVSPS